VPSDVTAIVVAYNSAHVIAGLLDSLPDALDGVHADIIVVDNGSVDDTLAVLASRDDCRVIKSTNIGYAAAINLAVRMTERTPAILVLNPDARLRPHAVSILIDTLRLPRTGVVAPQVRSEDGSLHLSLRREPSLPRALGLTATNLEIFSEFVGRPRDYDKPQVVDWALGAVLLMSRECYDAVGGWDPTYFLYSEETDFCLRARDIGLLTRYEPTAVADHIGAQSGQSAKTHTMQIVNRVRLYSRRHGLLASWAYYSLTILSESTWAVRSGRRSWIAILALLRPSRRPEELGCSGRVLPN
jgi:GT2 family glycosyltransferase